MNFWMIIILVGIVLLVFELFAFFKNMQKFKDKKSMFLVGIFLLVFLAYSYAETFTADLSSSVTFIDLGAILILGILSGIFISSFFLVDKIYLLKSKKLDDSYE